MKIDKAIRIFVEFLNSSWVVVSQSLLDRDWGIDEAHSDWLQANWELLVEQKVLKPNEYLEIYGEGADYNGASSRMVDPEASPNFKVLVKTKTGGRVLDVLNNEQVNLENVTFNKIVGFKNRYYILEPEFKYVLIDDEDCGVERVVAISDIEFRLGKL